MTRVAQFPEAAPACMSRDARESGRLHQRLRDPIIQDHVTDCRAASAPPTQIERPCRVVAFSRNAYNSTTQDTAVEKRSQIITLEAWPG